MDLRLPATLSVSALSLASWIFNAHCFAHTQKNALYALSLEDLLDLPVTASTLTEETAMSAPSSVTTFSQAQIRSLGVLTLAELANYVPGYQVLRSGSSSVYSMISSRGRRMDAVSTEILLLVDGQRTHFSQLSSFGTLSELPVSNIERVEFIRGPGAALYGSNAMMGVINVVTRSDENEASFELGNFGQAHGALVSHARLGHVDVDFAVDYYRASGDDYQLQDSFNEDQVTTPDPNARSNVHLKATLHDTTLLVHFFESHSEAFYILDAVDANTNEREEQLFSAALRHSISTETLDTTFNARVSRDTRKQTLRASAPGVFQAISDPESADPLLGYSEISQSEWEIYNQSSYRLNAKNRIGFGASLRQGFDVQDRTLSNYDTTMLALGQLPIDSSTQIDIPTLVIDYDPLLITGAYGQWQSQLSSTLQLTAGLRLDSYPDIDLNHLSPRLAFVWQPAEAHALKLIYGEAFRAPMARELYLKDNPFIFGNPDLMPETVHTTELVYVFGNSHIQYSLGTFINQFDDAIELDTLRQQGTLSTRRFVNTDYEPIKGLEFEAHASLSARWLVDFSATKIYETDPRSFRESTELADLVLHYATEQWQSSVSLIYRGPRENQDEDGFRQLPAYWQTRFFVGYAFSEAWQAQVVVENISDDTIWYPTQGAGVPQGIPARGRAFRLGLNYQF